MRVSELFLATQREIPADAEIPSHRLMLRAGLIRKMASGVYSFMPMGYRTYRKVEAVIREEMDKAGAQELIMPALLPAEAYQGSGRWEKFGPEMFRLTDRGGRSFCLGPTHEEPFTEAVRDSIRSYKQLPVTLYQIQHKYRDEKRPRFGVIRAREFVMKDAYSFDVDEAGLDISYKKMYDAYRAIFDRTVVVFEGNFKRNYLHVRDAAGAFLFAINNFEKMQGRQYNCGLSDCNISKLELCAKIKEHIPSFVYIESPIGTDPDKRDYIVSNERLESMGWRPSFTVDDGIEELIKTYQIVKNNQYSNI